MNRTRKICALMGTAVVCAGLLGGALAGASNGIQFTEFDVEGPFYVDCVDEYVYFKEHIKIAYHEFETPSGNFHVVDKWTFTLTGEGESTGRLWAAVLPSPTTMNFGPAQTTTIFIKGVVRALTDDTPAFFWDLTYQSTVNANGEMVFQRGDGIPVARCLGKKN